MSSFGNRHVCHLCCLLVTFYVTNYCYPFSLEAMAIYMQMYVYQVEEVSDRKYMYENIYMFEVEESVQDTCLRRYVCFIEVVQHRS